MTKINIELDIFNMITPRVEKNLCVIKLFDPSLLSFSERFYQQLKVLCERSCSFKGATYYYCLNFRSINISKAYSSSYNLTPPICQVLIGQQLIFCSLTSPTPVKYMKRQKAGFLIVNRQPHRYQNTQEHNTEQ